MPGLIFSAEVEMKVFFKILLGIIIAGILAAALAAGFLTVTEYRPDDVEALAVTGSSSGKKVPVNEPIEIISWNVGFAALGKDADFVMDGGGNVPMADKKTVISNLEGMESILYSKDNVSIYLLQEADIDSKRSYHIDFRDEFFLSQNAFALNYSCPFVPFPWLPFGRVNSGLLTASDYEVEAAERISLPCPFSWPLRVANLKRCLLVSYLPVEDSDKQLVLINLHLEAYDSGEGKIAQTKQLKEFMQNEYDQGNYVIAAGDFNQLFPDTEKIYPNTHPENWEVGMLEEDSIPEGFRYVFDESVPTCRLLNQPYDPEDTVNTQYYVIDGMIVSPNVQVERVETLDEGFVYSDHNPVHFALTLQPEV